MQQDLIEIIKLLGSLPGATLWAIGMFVIYKIIIYMSTTGAIVYLGKELFKIIQKYLDKPVPEKDPSKLYYYHGLVRKPGEKKSDWLYNRNSLADLATEGYVEEFYCGLYRVSGYM